jgi:nucleotide-binding universal stress UspA family protein
MIVMASKGWTNLPYMTIGDITDKIRLQSNVPVVCVKSNFISN